MNQRGLGMVRDGTGINEERDGTRNDDEGGDWE